MKTKTGLVALGLFALAGVNLVNCGGSSDDSSSSTGTSGNGGTKSTAGSSSTAGTTSPGGESSSGGTNSGTAGTVATTAGTGGNVGTAGNNGTAGTNNNQGGANDMPGAGGANNNPPGCPAAIPADGSMCTQLNQVRGGCDYGAMNCRCARPNRGSNMLVWQCDAAFGNGGAGPGDFGAATCPANAMTNQDCTNGPGTCAGQNRCICNQQDKIICF